jgi:uncharacterized protein GlcG (DUF336 family)
MTLGVTLDQARQIVAGTLAAGRRATLKPLTVVVLDAGGHVTAVEREDGSSNNRFQIAHGKAHGALAFGFGSRELFNRAQSGATAFLSAVNGALGGALVPVPGGVLVRDADGTLLGAVGVSGDNSDNDETAAVAGIESAGLVAQPD